MAVTVKDAVQEEQWLSDRVSSQVRMIAVGMLAFTWALLTNPPEGLIFHRRGLIVVGLLSLFALVIDLLQYLAGYVDTVRHRRDLEASGDGPGYRLHAVGRRLRVSLFWLKQGVVVGAFTLLLVLVLPPML